MRQSEPPMPKSNLPLIVEDPAEPEVLATVTATAIPTPKVEVSPVKMRPAAAVSAGSKGGR